MKEVSQQKEIEDAREIAIRCLRNCYGNEGIYAGTTHFKDYWARDSFFGSLGALEIGDFDIVKKNLELFIKFVKEDKYGKIVPLRIGSPNALLMILGIHSTELIPKYIQDKGNNFAYDSNPLFIIVLDEYLKKTKDFKFLEKNKEVITEIVEWCVNQINSEYGLVKTGKYATWQDSIKKEGFTLYNNILTYEASKRATYLLKDNKYKEISKKIKDRINKYFWNGSFYDDFFKVNKFGKKEKNFSIFTPLENAFAIIFELADKKRALLIEKYVEKSDLNKIVPSLTNYQAYPKKEISLLLRIGGIGDYHNHSMAWIFVGACNSIAKKKIGFVKEAHSQMEKISRIIKKFDNVYECYETHGKNCGKPVKRLTYHSEKNFAMSCGCYLLADKIIFKNGS
jgi:hypothetical protein